MKTKQILLKLVPHRIWHQIGLVFALILIGSLGFLGYLLIHTSEGAVKDSVLRDYEEISRGAAREISSFINNAQDQLVNTAGMVSIMPADDVETQQLLIYQLITDAPGLFERVALTGLDGQERVSSDLPAYEAGREAGLKERTQSEVFQQTLTAQKPAISKVYFSEEHFPYITIAVPIQRLNKLSGVLMAEVKLSGIWEILTKIKSAEDQIFLVDETGYVLVHNEEKKVYRGENIMGSRAVQSVLQGQAGSIEEGSSEPETDDRWLSAYAPIRPLGWGLVIRQPIKAAYAFSFRMKKTAFLIIAGAIGLAILLSLFIAKWIVRPIRKLTEVTAKVAAGDLDQSIKSERKDEVGRLLTSFNEMIRRLKKAKGLEKLSNIGLATSKIAHELRNPLVALKTFTQLLPRRHQDKKFIAQFQQTVPHEMTRLENMLGELTNFSAIHQLRLGDCNIVSLIKDSLELFKEQIVQQKVKVATRLEPKQMSLRVDSDKIKQVFINLIRNAVEAMPQGGALNIDSKIYLDRPGPKNTADIPAPDRQQKILEIKFTDTGCGMDEAKLAKAFEPFHTSKRDGLGLGLSICKEIIEQHQGRVEIESQAGQGTVFTIRLPLGN